MSGIYHRDDIPNDLRGFFVRAEIGLEPSPDQFVAELVAVFREVKRVLRGDGTVWLNLGDSYNAHPGQRKTTDRAGEKQVSNAGSNTAPSRHVNGLKPKDLIGIPWRVAFALQADGWCLRQDIIWHKPNPMPESVQDRCTKAHEYLFLLSKSARYYFDADAIAETSTTGDNRKPYSPGQVDARGDGHDRGGGSERTNGLRDASARNKRSVWTVATQPFGEAHFATFPPALIEPCILAGCPVGGAVLDPFGGAGTTGLVADRLQRDAILIELNPEYAEMAKRRIHNDAPLFSEVHA